MGAIDLAHPASANLLDDAVMAQGPAKHGKAPPSLSAILSPAPWQVNAKGLLREVQAAEEGVEAGVEAEEELRVHR